MTECLTIHICINHSETTNQRKKTQIIAWHLRFLHLQHYSHPPLISQISGELGFHFTELELHQLPDTYRLRLESSSLCGVELRLISTVR